MDPLTLGIIVAGALVLLAKSKGATDNKTPPPGGGTTAPGGGGVPGGGISSTDLAGATTSVVGVVGATVGLLKTAGVIGGTATVGTTVATTSAAGTTTTVAASASEAAAAGGVSAGAVLVEVGVAALILAIEIVIGWAWLTLSKGGEGWQRWVGQHPSQRLAGLWFLEELRFVQQVVEPSGINPKTGQPPQEIPHQRVPVKQLEAGNFYVGVYVPTEIQLPAAELLRLYRTASYLALRKIAAYNEVEFTFFENAYVGKNSVDVGNAITGAGKFNTNGDWNARGLRSDAWAAFVDDVLRNEPWGDDLHFRTACDYSTLEAEARSLLVPNFDLFVKQAEFLGRVMALTDAAITGWPWLGWPGDEGFNRQLIGFAGLGGGPGRGAGIPGQWTVDTFWVNGGNRWVAVDPVTKFGLDLQQARANHSAVCYSPEQLAIGVTPKALDSQARPVSYSIARPVGSTRVSSPAPAPTTRAR